MNLLLETMDVLIEHGKTRNEILWIGNSENSWSWEDFSKIADFEYDVGCAYIPEDLVIVGEDWWLERHEYRSGIEGWIFKEMPTRCSANEHFVLKIEDLNNYAYAGE